MFLLDSFFCASYIASKLVSQLIFLNLAVANFITRNRTVIFYGICLAILLALLNWLKLRFIIIDHAFEIYIGAIALLFTAVGIWFGLKYTKPKTVIVNQILPDKNHFVFDEAKVAELSITKRELEVLQLMAEGLSNKEIADRLFLSLSTVKSHSNNLFDKLGVQRRTQAVDQGRKLQIIR
jgi:two-component system, NarL family, response regulator LiaR